jgi:hypothetical protein
LDVHYLAHPLLLTPVMISHLYQQKFLCTGGTPCPGGKPGRGARRQPMHGPGGILSGRRVQHLGCFPDFLMKNRDLQKEPKPNRCGPARHDHAGNVRGRVDDPLSASTPGQKKSLPAAAAWMAKHRKSCPGGQALFKAFRDSGPFLKNQEKLRWRRENLIRIGNHYPAGEPFGILSFHI